MPSIVDLVTQSLAEPCRGRVFVACSPLMKNVERIELTLDDLGGKEPIAGNDLVLGGIHYRIMHVKPPKVRSSKWKRRQGRTTTTPKWSLLLQQLDDPE